MRVNTYTEKDFRKMQFHWLCHAVTMTSPLVQADMVRPISTEWGRVPFGLRKNRESFL
jgi:hypothetical protein